MRARFCELAGGQRRARSSASELFTLGLFSVIDALMDAPIEQLLDQLPFPQDMREALAAHAGADGACSSASPPSKRATSPARLLVPNAGELYLAALRWSVEAAQPLFATAATAA